jgi:hypothetical protein
MRGSASGLDVCNTQAANYGRTYIVCVEINSFYAERGHNVLSKDLYGSAGPVIFRKGSNPAMEETNTGANFFGKSRNLVFVPVEEHPVVSFVYPHCSRRL